MSDLLRPDPTIVKTHPDITWCLPVGDHEFKKLITVAERFRGITPQGMRYVRRIGQRRERLVLVMAPQLGCTLLPGTGEHELPILSREEIETECAWLRLCKDIRQPIYVIPSGLPLEWHTNVPPSILPGTAFVEEWTVEEWN